jgi:2-methylcitrate dehydratase PrpD
MPNAAESFAAHVAGVSYDDIPNRAMERAKVYVLDTLGVGIAGSSAQGAAELLSCARAWGEGTTGTVWGRRDRLPAHSAAFLNAFAVHCQEYDCVNEPAVLHPMATLLPAALAQAERQGNVSGKDLLTAITVGVDVSANLGIASTQGLKFFRPATAGGFGAAAAVAKLRGLDADTIVNAFGIQLAQTSGSMQAHAEASPVLPMQVGFNSRAGMIACDVAATGLTGPRGSIDGPYGYLPLIEGGFDLPPVIESLGKTWQVAEMSHKPYPAGRATHGAIEGLEVLRDKHGFTADDVESFTVTVPPLTGRLVSRPDLPNPTANYARLCCAYVVAKVLQHGKLDLSHYRGAELTNPETHRLAKLVTVAGNDNPDPNALAPQSVQIRLKDGSVLDWSCDVMLANPARPLSQEAHLAKFRRCWEFAAEPLPEANREALITLVDHLQDVTDIKELLHLLTP